MFNISEGERQQYLIPHNRFPNGIDICSNQYKMECV